MPTTGGSSREFADWRTDTAERSAVRGDAGPSSDRPAGEPSVIPPTAQPLPPPPAFETPPAPRYPLYADELGDPGAPDDDVPAWLAPSSTPRRRTTRLLPAAVALLAVVAMAAGGVVLLGHRGGDPVADLPPAAVDPSTAASPSTGPAPSSAPSTGDHGGRPGKQDGKHDRHSKNDKSGKDGKRPGRVPVDVTRFARVTAPPSAPPGVDTRGNVVRYGSFNLIDGVPSTAWRMVGDGQGRSITLRLRRPTVLTQVGLINGYVKRDGGYDGYRSNRHVKRVRWLFDGGRSVTQELRGTRSLQTVAVPSVRTRTVRLVLERVGRARRSPDGRDYTAISDLSLLGTPS